MVLSIPCGQGTIRLYERLTGRGDGYEPQVEYRAAFTACRNTRLWGAWSTSIQSTVASLLPKLKLNKEQRDAVWAAALKVSETRQPAMSHKSRMKSCPSEVVFFKKNPFQGIVRPRVRKEDGKVRLALSRKGHERVSSNWHCTREEAF